MSEDNRHQSSRLLEIAFAAGVNFFDTAPTYAYGSSEEALGAAFSGRREQVCIATKGGFRLSSWARFARYLLPISGALRRPLASSRATLKRGSRKRSDFSARHLRTQLEGSLRRLRSDHTDLYQLHGPPAVALASDEVHRFLEDIVSEGKARLCGASVGTAAEALLCLRHPVFSALQIAFNVLDQQAATSVFPVAIANGAAIIVKTPLQRGLLTGKHRVLTGMETEPPDERIQAQRRADLAFLLTPQHRSVEAAALRFILDHAAVTTLLAGTSNPDHLRENIAAVESPALPESVMKRAAQFAGVNAGE